MDPVSLVVAAVVAGASTALKDTASDALKGAYRELKALLQRRFEGNPEAQGALAKVEDDPETRREHLEEQLRRAPQPDADVIRAADEVLTWADPDGMRAGKYRVTITGGRGIVVGDHANVNMTIRGD